MEMQMVSYTVKPGQAAENEELIKAMLAELEQVQPAGFRYVAFKAEDGLGFVHVMGGEGRRGQHPAPPLPAMKAFHAGLRQRCEAAPIRTKLTEIGSFGLVGEVNP